MWLQMTSLFAPVRLCSNAARHQQVQAIKSADIG